MNFSRSLLVALIIATISGCSKGDENVLAPTTQGGGVATGSPATEVRLGFFPNLTHGQAVLGVTSREFEAAVAPAKFTSRHFNAGPSLIEALFANQIDIGYIGPGPAISAFVRSKGQGIRVIAGAASDGVVIVARKDSGINSLADLKDKKIAVPQRGNTQDIAARHYLSTTLGQSKGTPNVLPVPNADQAGMMSRGDIDASWAPEPWGTILIASAGAKLIGEEKDLWPKKTFDLAVIVTTPEFLSAHPDAVEKILKVHRAWTARLTTESPKYVPQLEQALTKLTGKALPPGITAEALSRVKFNDEPSTETFEANAQWAYDQGVSKERPNVATLFDLAVLRKTTN